MKGNKALFEVYILTGLVCLVFGATIIWYIIEFTNQKEISVKEQQKSKNIEITDVGQFKKKSMIHDELSEYGEQIVKYTSNYFYKNNEKIGNHLNCENCHIDAGTMPFAAPFIGLIKVYPLYSERLNRMESLEDRINDCFERSMNAEAIDKNSLEMKAIVAYISKLSHNVKKEGRIKGQGLVEIQIPDRKADPQHGKIIYNNQCSACHGMNGQGTKDTNNQYTYPPLWGNDTYNNGAGMAQVVTAARFIKGNMPFGTTFNKPVLTDEQAYDVAGYINSFSRPIKKENKH